MPAISGVVRDAAGAYAQRLVRLYDRASGSLLAQTVSDPSTGAYSFTTSSTDEVYVLALDATSFDQYWNNVVLALHMNDTGLTDVKGHAVTLNGNAARSATQSKFGGYAAYFDGNGDYLSIADTADLEPGSGDFTVDGWVYISAYASSYSGTYRSVIAGKDTSGARSWHFALTGTASSWTGLVFSTAGTELSASYTFSNNTWYHVAVCKSGTNLRFFVDGTQVGTTQTHNTALADVGTALTIGAILYSGFQYYLTGYVDDFRLTKAARYTANFTAPTAAFVDGVSGGTENIARLDRMVPA